MSAADFSHFDKLVSGYLDNALAERDADELLAMLEEPLLAARFLEATRLNSEIAGLLAAPVPDAAMVELVRADIEKHVNAARPARELHLEVVERPHAVPSSPPAIRDACRVPDRRRPSRRALAWAAVFLVFVGLAAGWLAYRGRTADSPSVASLRGEVRFVSTAGERVLKADEAWARGEKLKTIGVGSAVTVNFPDGSQIDFGSDSVAVNQSGAEGPRVELERGVVRSNVRKQPAGRPFVFATPEAEAIVIGTALEVSTDGHHTKLFVTEGQVLLKRRSDRAEIMVSAGFHVFAGTMNKLKAEPNTPGMQHH